MQTLALRLTTILLVSLLVASCSNTPRSEAVMTYDRQFDFAKVQKIVIEPFSRADPATITVSDQQIARISGAIGDELRRRGFEMVQDNMAADLLVSWSLVTEDNGSAHNIESTSYAIARMARPRTYAKGTLVVDMIDPIRNRPVWRSVFKSQLRAEPDSEKSGEYRRTAAQAVFADFPPKPSGGQ